MYRVRLETQAKPHKTEVQSEQVFMRQCTGSRIPMLWC